MDSEEIAPLRVLIVSTRGCSARMHALEGLTTVKSPAFEAARLRVMELRGQYAEGPRISAIALMGDPPPDEEAPQQTGPQGALLRPVSLVRAMAAQIAVDCQAEPDGAASLTDRYATILCKAPLEPAAWAEVDLSCGGQTFRVYVVRPDDEQSVLTELAGKKAPDLLRQLRRNGFVELTM